MGQSFIFDADDKDQETGPAFIAGRINEALQALNATVDTKLVNDAARDLWDKSVRYLIEQNGHLGEDSSLFNFREKALANLDWLKPYGVTGDRWADAAIKQPSLFHQKPETLRANFEANLDWLKPYGVTGDRWADAAIKHPSLFNQKPETLRANFEANLDWLKTYGVTGDRWADAAIKQPQLFYQKPETLRANFELLMVVAETPAFKPRDTGLSFNETRVAWIMSRPSFLSLAEDNLLMRLAFAEITHPKPSATLLKDTRGKVEHALVKSLGHDAKKQIVACEDAANPEVKKARAERLKAELKSYADLLRQDWRSRPKAVAPRDPEIGILSVLSPPGNPARQQALLENMILGGLLQQYKLAS